MFIGNGGGVQLAFDDGEFKVPGRVGRPKRMRFGAPAPDPAPKPVVDPKPVIDAVSHNVTDEPQQKKILEEEAADKKAPGYGRDLF